MLDVSGLPSVAFGHRNTSWLANVFYMAIEGHEMFALMFAAYFYSANALDGLASRALAASFGIRCAERAGLSREHRSRLDRKETCS